jgi:allophanate hydrolase subunit 1
MISFIPGQANCMWLEPELVLTAPKYTQPRTHTPEGTVGLGGSSIALYSVPSPGGFQMVGRMPVPTYSPHPTLPVFESSPILLRVGDRLRLKSIDRDEYDAIAQAVREGTYRYEIAESRLTVDVDAQVARSGPP